MAATVTFIRHAETESNAAGRWQGKTDSSLSARGRTQARSLSDRMDSAADLLVCSDAGRAAATASMIGDHETDPVWGEIDLGAWDGLSTEEIRTRYPEEFAAIEAGEEFNPVGGETFGEFVDRVGRGFSGLLSRLDDGEHAYVVTHGGVIQVLVGSVLGLDGGFRGLQIPTNTAITTVRAEEMGRQVAVYNDAAHLNGNHRDPEPGATRLLLFRHGQTTANAERRWQGRSDSPLTDRGRSQVASLAVDAPRLDRIFSSPAQRARDTATAVATAQGLRVDEVDDLVEIDFGSWEGLTAQEARELDPAYFDHVYVEGNDGPRGQTGETFQDAAARFDEAVEGIAARADGAIGVFAHGGVVRAYLARVLGLPYPARSTMSGMRNTAYAEVRRGARGPLVASYNVGLHIGV